MQTIKSCKVKSRKAHVCDFCGCEIPKGERYKRSVNVFDGRPYTWKSHLRCAELCGKIWNYVDPDDNGMTSDEFYEAVQDLALTFYCPFHCEEYDRDTQDCERGLDANVCIKRFAQFMENHELELVNDHNRGMCWRMVEIEREVK